MLIGTNRTRHLVTTLPRFFLTVLTLWLCSPARANEQGALCTSTNTNLAEWRQWRGPMATGVSPSANPPITWSETNNVRWKIAIPGKSHASPIVSGNFVVLLTAVPVGEAQKPVYDDAPGTHDSVPVTHRHQFMALAVGRRDGKRLWQKVLREEFPHEGG